MKKILILLSFFMLYSCSGLMNMLNNQDTIKKPNAKIVDVKITGLSFEKVDLVFDIEIQNPNSVGINMSGLNYELLINDQDFIDGEDKNPLKIKSKGKSIVKFPLSLTYLNLYRTYKNVEGKKDIEYEFRTKLGFTLPVIGEVKIPLKTKGKIPGLSIPNLKFKSINFVKIKKKSFIPVGVVLALKMAVDNKNSSSVFLNGMNYKLNVNGKNWLDGKSTKKINLENKKESVIEVPIYLEVQKLGPAIIDMVRGNTKLDYELDTDLLIGSSLPLVKEFKKNFSFKGKTNLVK